MVSYGNIEYFLNNHPEFNSTKQAILDIARNLMDNRRIISNEHAKQLLGIYSMDFFNELKQNPIHREIFKEQTGLNPDVSFDRLERKWEGNIDKLNKLELNNPGPSESPRNLN